MNAPSLADIYRSAVADAKAGRRRCDSFVVFLRQSSGHCEQVATEIRLDEPRGYSHPFCGRHAAEWDATPEDDR